MWTQALGNQWDKGTMMHMGTGFPCHCSPGATRLQSLLYILTLTQQIEGKCSGNEATHTRRGGRRREAGKLILPACQPWPFPVRCFHIRGALFITSLGDRTAVLILNIKTLGQEAEWLLGLG